MVVQEGEKAIPLHIDTEVCVCVGDPGICNRSWENEGGPTSSCEGALHGKNKSVI